MDTKAWMGMYVPWVTVFCFFFSSFCCALVALKSFSFAKLKPWLSCVLLSGHGSQNLQDSFTINYSFFLIQYCKQFVFVSITCLNCSYEH